MRLIHRLSIVGVLYVMAASNTTQTTGTEPSSNAYWRIGPACGPNALYCLLRVNDRAVNYPQLLTFLSQTESGSSLEELRGAANHWGLGATVQEFDKSSIGKLKTPFIAHLAVQESQHHVVVVGLAKDNVLIWDDEQGTVREVANERFFRDWSGYVLSTGTRGFDRLVGAILVVEITCFCILCGFLVNTWIRRRRFRPMHPS